MLGGRQSPALRSIRVHRSDHTLQPSLLLPGGGGECRTPPGTFSVWTWGGHSDAVVLAVHPSLHSEDLRGVSCPPPPPASFLLVFSCSRAAGEPPPQNPSALLPISLHPPSLTHRPRERPSEQSLGGMRPADIHSCPFFVRTVSSVSCVPQAFPAVLSHSQVQCWDLIFTNKNNFQCSMGLVF